VKLTREERQRIKTPVSRKDVVLSLLRGAIMDGRLAAGARLDQNEIAASFGVSRMPVREALKQLELEGLVAVYPYRGVEVASLEASQIEELFAIRIALERLAVGQAVRNLKPRQLTRLRSILTTMDGLVEECSGDDKWMQLNQEFHGILNGACGWPRLIALIDQHRTNVDRYIRSYLTLYGRRQSQGEHWELLEACAKGHSAAAQKVIERHLNNTAEALVAALGEASPPDKPRTSPRASRRSGG
jgi:DNA-binding GntR family transcriptional regulator